MSNERFEDPQSGDLSTGEGGELLNGEQEVYSAEPAKPRINQSTLVLIALVALGGGGLYLMHLKSGPKAAAAAEVQQASAAITSFLSDGTKNIGQMRQMLRDTEKVVDLFEKYPANTQVPIEKLRTNPFRVAAPSQAAGEPSDATLQRRREAERQLALAAVQKLQLQSVIHSDSQKACMVNNTMVREGQTVEGFVIERINSNAVIVRKGSYRFELRMQR